MENRGHPIETWMENGVTVSYIYVTIETWIQNGTTFTGKPKLLQLSMEKNAVLCRFIREHTFVSYWWKKFFQHPLIRAGCLCKGRGGKSSSFNWYAPPAWMALSPQIESWACSSIRRTNCQSNLNPLLLYKSSKYIECF